MRTTPAESITRAARLLRHKYPATEQVTEARYKRFVEERSDNGEMIVVFK